VSKFVRSHPAPMQTKLLNFLLINQGRVVTHAECLDYLYGDDPNGGPTDGHILDQFLLKLRERGWPIENEMRRGLIIRWQRPVGAHPFDGPEEEPWRCGAEHWAMVA
jgi:DNA-binding response OmpR family regulator